jgi:hypothetical protein
VQPSTLNLLALLQAISQDTQLFQYLRNEWRFSPGPRPDTTLLDFRVDFAFRSALYNHAAGLFFDEVISKMVSAYEHRCKYVFERDLYKLQNTSNGVHPWPSSASQPRAHSQAHTGLTLSPGPVRDSRTPSGSPPRLPKDKPRLPLVPLRSGIW